MHHKLSHIQLGAKPTNTYARIVPNTYNNQFNQNQAQYQQISKCFITSPHRISEKASPSKVANVSHRTERLGSFDNENSFLQLNDSHLSIVTSPKRIIQSPLRDRANIAQVNRQFVRVNFVNNSPSHSNSKTSSTHIRQMKPSPTKMVRCITKVEGEEEVLLRKVKVLEGRIAELYREKHETVAKLNEQNRIVYHENTSLKLKISELSKKIEKKPNNVDSQKITSLQKAISELKIQLQKKEERINTLNNQIRQKQAIIEDKDAQINEKQQIITQKQSIIAQKEQQLSQIASIMAENQTLHESLAHFQHFSSENDKQEEELREIKKNLQETTQNNALICEQYEMKIEEYRIAYDRNQEVIEQLTRQLEAVAPTSSYPSGFDSIEESQLKESAEKEENRLAEALKESQKQVLELIEQNQQQAFKLEEACNALDKYAIKIQQMEKKYSELRPSLQSPCSKCQELTKTVFRLNARLNQKIQ